MSRPRRTGKSDRKPQAEREPDDDLPTLEELADELEELPGLGDADGADAVRVDCSPADEAGFDTAVGVTVPEMEKASMPAAVEAPLRRVVGAAAAKVRHHRVVVTFVGDTIIGSAVKDLCGEVLRHFKARKVVVRRGYGDELVHEGELPRVQVQRTVDGDVMRVEVETGQLEAADLQMALQPELVGLVAAAKGQRLEFAFSGSARPDAALRQLLARTLGDAGALRLQVGQRVLFDRELERRVQLVIDGPRAKITVDPAEREVETEEAIAMVLGDAGERLQDKDITVELPQSASSAVLQQCLQFCVQAEPQRVAVSRDGGPADVLWPALLTLEERGDEVALRVAAGGRDRAALLVAFRRESAELGDRLRGKAVAVHWESGTKLDSELEQQCLREGIGAFGPRALWTTVGGGEREILLPPPVALRPEGALRLLQIDTDAGKPPELVRAFERWLPGARDELRGKPVRVAFAGAVAPSRTVQKAVLEAVEQAGAVRVELDDHGAIDVVAPPLLAITGSAREGFRVAAAAAGRDADQIERALQRELDAGESWIDAVVTLVPSALTERLLAVAVDRGASRVILGGPTPVQVHPPALIGARRGDELRLEVTPTADPAMVRRQIERELASVIGDDGLDDVAVTIVWNDAPAPDAEPLASLLNALLARGPGRVLLDRGGQRPVQLYPEVVREVVSVLGRKAEAEAPMWMLGIGVGDDPAHVQAVQARLAELQQQLAGARVLLVARGDGRDLPQPGDDPAFAAARDAVTAVAAATLVFRGLDPRRRPFFAVVQSTLDALPVGKAVADPRPRG